MRTWLVLIAMVVAAAPAAPAQDQQSRSRPGWPCNGHPDASYFETAEATGGQVFLFHPSEIAGSGSLMAAGMTHRQTLFRVAGDLQDGLHEFTFPVDAAVEDLLVSVSLQCLQVVEIARPSGDLLQAADPSTDYHQFEAGRFVTIATPPSGTWRVRVSGHGLFFLVVQAKTPLGLDGVQVVRKGTGDVLTPIYTPLTPGRREMLRLSLPAGVHDVRARLVSAAFEEAGPIDLAPRESDDGGWAGTFTVPGAHFRVVVTAVDADGRAFQRVHAPLFRTTAGR